MGDRPQGRNQNGNPPNTRFFTGNQAIDSAAWGAALGAGTQYFANQVFNPCRNRGGTRNSNTKGTNNRIFGNSNIDNGILGFLGGFAAASVAQNAGLTSSGGQPTGKAGTAAAGRRSELNFCKNCSTFFSKTVP